jgi:hypothetical protein
MYPFENNQLGINDDEVEISAGGETHRAATLMAQQYRRDISIISRALDPLVYDIPDFVDSVKIPYWLIAE